MRQRSIGSLRVPVIGLGCNNFGGRLDEAGTKSVLDAAIEHGVTFLDTADVYGGTRSEEFMGRVLEGRRDRVVIATKFGSALGSEVPGGASPDYVRAAVQASLTRLRTDRIDLYQIHRPDPEVPVADTLGALADLVSEGFVREVGCSNFSASQLDEAERAATGPGGSGVRFVSVQNEYSLLRREPESEVLPACVRLDIAFLPYFPLFSGLLTGKYRRGQPLPAGTRITGNPRWEAHLTDENFDVIERLGGYAEQLGMELIDLAFAWLLAKPQVASVIAGASTPAQVSRNAATAAFELSHAQVAAVDGLLSA